eukprot:1960943-Amphidinium_carterae.1
MCEAQQSNLAWGLAFCQWLWGGIWSSTPASNHYWSMNSVMDDNRLLTLPSNERITLKVDESLLGEKCRETQVRAALRSILSCSQAHMKMIFEIRDLNYATPATATRAGIATDTPVNEFVVLLGLHHRVVV